MLEWVAISFSKFKGRTVNHLGGIMILGSGLSPYCLAIHTQRWNTFRPGICCNIVWAEGKELGGCGWTSEARPAMSRSLLQLAAGTTGSQSKFVRVWLTKMAWLGNAAAAMAPVKEHLGGRQVGGHHWSHTLWARQWVQWWRGNPPSAQ